MSINDKVSCRHGCRTGEDQIVEVLVGAGIVAFNVEAIIAAGDRWELDLLCGIDESSAGVVLDLDSPVCASNNCGCSDGPYVSTVSGIRSSDDELLGEIRVILFYRHVP